MVSKKTHKTGSEQFSLSKMEISEQFGFLKIIIGSNLTFPDAEEDGAG